MTAFVTDFVGHEPRVGSERIEAYIAAHDFDRPTLVIDRDLVAQNHAMLRAGLGDSAIHYAVKANPAREILEALIAVGCHFDAASRGEIELCLSLGAAPETISFGNTVKKAGDIAFAHAAGVTLFAADAVEELDKIAANAPGAQVYIRVIVEASQADWPLSRKFGCSGAMVVPLLDHARALGLDPIGLSFHVGSQTRQAAMWAATLDALLPVWEAAADAGHTLRLLNIGGGFPAYYGDPIAHPTQYAAEVMALVRARFCDVAVMAEPGRGLVADAGMIVAEVVLVSRKSDADLHRWVYLDIGKFSGLAETIDEAIRYQFVTDRDHDAFGPCILAGPSCDSFDVLYEKKMMSLPLSLAAGDRIVIRNCGAYTSSYASVGFNGFPPLDVVAI